MNANRPSPRPSLRPPVGLPALVAASAIASAVPRVARADISATLETAINLPDGPGSLEGFGQGHDTSSNSGLLTLAYPMELPPGRAGLQPDLAFRYDAGQGDGLAGLGWSLSLPRVERSMRKGIPRYDATDTFVLSGLGRGEELVEVESGVWRERFEGEYPVVVRQTSQGFTAHTVDGRTYTFGSSGDARLEAAPGVFAWSLESIEDNFGNRVEYHYTRLAGTTQPLLERIVYNDGAAAVEFAYEARPDQVVRRTAGFRTAIEHRLATVDSLADGEPAQHWALSYANSTSHPVSRLVAIASEAADGTQLPTWKLGYGVADQVPVPVSMADSLAVDPTAHGFALMDVDGDALPDLVRGEVGAWEYRRNQAAAGFSEWIAFDISPSIAAGPNATMADLTGDGVVDLLHQAPTGEVTVFEGGGASPMATATAVDLDLGFELSDPRVALVDMNADGRVDIVASTEAGAFVWERHHLAPGYRTVLEAPAPPAGMRPGDPGVFLADVDGDRLPDLVRIIAEDNRIVVLAGLGHGLFGPASELDGAPSMDAGARWELRDVNGDGAADLLRIGSQRLDLWINQLDGGLAPDTSVTWPELDAGERVVLVDMNANGTTDVLRVDPVGGQWQYWDLAGARAGLLASLDNGLGYTAKFDWETAAAHAQRDAEYGQPWTRLPGISVPVLSTVTEDDGLDWGRVLQRTVRDGFYDGVEGAFRGFGEVVETRVGDEYTDTRLVTRRYDVGAQDPAAAGRLLGEMIGSPQSALRETRHTIEVDEPTPGVRVARTIATEVFHIEGKDASETRRTRAEFEFDQWGNELERRELGEVDPETGADIPGDERTTTRRFAVPTSPTGPHNKLAEEFVTDRTGVRVQGTRAYYDGAAQVGLALGVVGDRAALHRRERWREGEQWVSELRQVVDPWGNTVRFVDAGGGTLTRTFDELGRFPVQERLLLDDSSPLDFLETTASWDPRFGKPLRVTDPAGAVTTVAYDGLGRPLAVARPGDDLELPTTAYTYFLDGSVFPPAVATAQRRNHGEDGEDDVERSIQHLDGLARLRFSITEDDLGEAAIVAEARQLDVDGASGLVLVPHPAARNTLEPGSPPEFDPSESATRTSRDALGRTVSVENPDGRRSQDAFEPLAQIHRDNEDLLGAWPYQDSPRITESDGLGRVVEIRDELHDRAVVHQYLWDAADRLSDHIDPAGSQTTWTHDGLGNLTEIDSPDAGVTTQAYRETGELQSRTDARGARVEMDYDIVGRKIAERGFAADGSATGEVTYGWDVPQSGESEAFSAGRLSTVADMAGRVDNVYDARGRVAVTRRRFELGDRQVSVSVARRYDAQDRVAEEVYPDGKVLHRVYGQRGLERSVPGFAEAIAHDPAGRLVSMELANGVSDVRTHDQVGRVLTQNVGGDGTDHMGVEHSYDAAGLLATTTDHLGPLGGVESLDQRFGYDNLHRLVSADAAYGRRAYAYEDNGNLTALAGLELAYDGPRPHAITAAGGQVLEYDAAGQLARVTGDGALAAGTWSFDSWGRAASFVGSSGTVASIYDHAGSRAIRRQDGSGHGEVLYFGPTVEVRDGQLVRWVFAAGQRIAEVPVEMPDDGFPPLPTPELLVLGLCLARTRRPRSAATEAWRRRITASMLWALGAMTLVGCRGCGTADNILRPNKDTRWHIQDRLGSGSLVLDNSGALVARSASLPYGGAWIEWASGKNTGPTYRFTGKEDDRAAGAIHFGARVYLPGIGRWASPDPMYLRMDITRNLHLPGERNMYGYVLGNPIGGVDLLGYETRQFGVSVGAAVVGGVSLSVGLIIDDKGNWGVAATVSGTVETGAGVEVGAYVERSTADTVDDAAGPSLSAGTSVGEGLRLSGEVGVSLSGTSVRETAGLGVDAAPAAGHLSASETVVISANGISMGVDSVTSFAAEAANFVGNEVSDFFE